MTSISLNQQNASMYLGRLFQAAAGATDAEGVGLKSKGLQIADGSIKLKPTEVDRLLTHVDKMTPAEKADALRCLDFFRDKFVISDEPARKKLLDFVPKSAVPLDVGGRVRSVADAQAESVTPPVTAPAADIKEAAATVDAIKEAAGPGSDTMVRDAHKAMQQPFADNDVKASPEDGGRKEVVKTAAKAPPQYDPFEDFARSPFFEDRLMAALGRNSMKFMNDMNKKLSEFDDPQRDLKIRDTMKSNVKELMKQADRLSPDAKARVANQIVEFAKANPGFADGSPELKQFVDIVGKQPAGANPNDILKNFPHVDNAVLAAMDKSDRAEVREWGAVFKAANQAEQIKKVLGSSDIDSMDEGKLHQLHEQAQVFQGELGALKDRLPTDVQAQIGDIKLASLPPQLDQQSRQVQFQAINMMMQQYQQIMQAMSEIINKMNEMAMDPVRKMGR